MAEFTVRAEAPGRVNLIGEHTDYNGGFVLPMAIPQRTRIELTPRPGREVELVSRNQQGPSAHKRFTLGEERREQDWADYVRGVCVVLKKHGLKVGGFEASIDSDVPMGSGLSSSAALEVSMMRALREAFGLALTDTQIAQLGQKVENDFVGARVGIMDQMASSLSSAGSALFLDTRDLSYKQLPIPTEVELMVINSGISHSNASGEYNTRRAECEKACELLGARQLRDLDGHDLGRLSALPDVISRRARHVITENDRVLAAVRAIESREWKTLGRLFGESHASMRDDYQVSIPEIDLLVELAQSEAGVYGARLTGGGFGGSIVAIARTGTAKQAAERVCARYFQRTGRRATTLLP